MFSAPTTNGYATAPFPSMDTRLEGKSSVAVKRGPEDDIQFVSSKPVKKLRASKESPTQTQGLGLVNAIPPGPISSAPLPSDRPASGSPGVGLGVSEPQPDHNMLNRGTSLPSMENYVFPSPGMASRTSRSSPMLSPKQLPPLLFPSRPTQTPSGIPTIAPDFGNTMQQRNFITQWEVSGLPLQHMALHSEMATNPPTLFPPIQALGTEPTGVIHGQEQPPPSSRPDTPKDPSPISGPVTQPMELHSEEIQKDRPHTPHKTPDQARTLQRDMTQGSWSGPQSAPQPPPRPLMAQPQFQAQQETIGSKNYAVSPDQSMPLKPPCLACERLRQQAFLNKANGFQGVHYPHLHHGWHGPGAPHHPHYQHTHMPSPPMSSPGFGMGSSIHRNQQHGFQHVPHGHIPTNYAFAQVPGQIPVQMTIQRGVPMANMTAGSEPFQGGPPSAILGNASSMGPSAPQATHHQYVQNHFAPSQPPATTPKSTAPQPTPPSPRTPRMPTPPPPQKHSPNLIVDIAETCEELFPWDQVAERHGIPRQKVVETFAAIIQLPLLRCTTDKKRHGRLATNRLKDYTRSKNSTKTSSPSSAASSSTSQQQPETTDPEDRPILHGVMELANSMSPLGLPSTLTNRFPGPW